MTANYQESARSAAEESILRQVQTVIVASNVFRFEWICLVHVQTHRYLETRW